MKCFLFSLSLIFSFQAGALGLAGTYPEGGTQIELQQQQDPDEISQGALIGYGYSAWWNPSLNITQVRSGDEAHLRAGIGSTAAWSGDLFQAAVVPGYSHETDVDLLHLCGEVSWDVNPHWTPYGRVAWETAPAWDVNSEVMAGVRWGGNDVDVIVERHLHNEQVWKAGLNWRWDKETEFNVEGNLPPAEHSWGVVVIFQPGGR